MLLRICFSIIIVLQVNNVISGNLKISGKNSISKRPHITLSWNESIGPGCPCTYNIYRSTISGGPYGRIMSEISGTSFSDYTGIRGTTYYYVATAVNVANVESIYSIESNPVMLP